LFFFFKKNNLQLRKMVKAPLSKMSKGLF